jgi:hypothetical protein
MKIRADSGKELLEYLHLGVDLFYLILPMDFFRLWQSESVIWAESAIGGNGTRGDGILEVK